MGLQGIWVVYRGDTLRSLAFKPLFLGRKDLITSIQEVVDDDKFGDSELVSSSDTRRGLVMFTDKSKRGLRHFG